MQRHNRPHRSGSGSISLLQAGNQSTERSMSGVGCPKMVRGASDTGKPRHSSMSSGAGMLRAPFGLSGLSTPPFTPQKRPNVQPLNSEKDNIRNIREKLHKYRIASENVKEESLEDLLPNEVVPVGVNRGGSGPFAANLSSRSPTASMRAEWQLPATPQRSTCAPSEKSCVTFCTQDSDITVGTHVFSAQDGATAQEREKKTLDPVTKAKKDLFRRLGKCRFDCREKKIRCFVSHHQIEDILILYLDAADDVRWALKHNSDPRQDERGSPTLMQRNASNRLAPSVEIDERKFLMQRTDELFEISSIHFDTGMNFEAEAPLDDRANSYALGGISGSMVHDWNGGQAPNMLGSNFSFVKDQQFGQGLGITNGYSSKSRSMGDVRMQTTPCQDGYAEGYQASVTPLASNSQSTDYQSTPSFGSIDGEAISDVAFSPFGEENYEVAELPLNKTQVLAMKVNSRAGIQYTCMIDDCFQYRSTSGHMLQHILTAHPQVRLRSADACKPACIRCWPNAVYPLGTLYCQAGCPQPLETHICGQMNGLQSVMELGSGDMDLDMNGPNDFMTDESALSAQDYPSNGGFGQQFQNFGNSQDAHSMHRR